MLDGLSPGDKRAAQKCLIYLATMAVSLVAGLVGGLIFGWEPFL